MEPVTNDTRALVDVVVDADDRALATAVTAAFAPHRVHVREAATTGEAVRAVADLAAGVVVVAATTPDDPSALHDRLALRVRRWVAAADVVGARVVLVSRDEVFDGSTVPPDGVDEFAPADAVDPVGRARRAGEGQLGADHALVRVASGDRPEAVAALVRWAALAVGPATWHLPDGTGDVLHAGHTRAVRDASSTATTGRREATPDTTDDQEPA